MQPNEKYDVTLIGSGLAGTMLATILARHGFKVLVLEAGQHPKFSIGESLIIETSEVLRTLSELFDIPEIAHFSSENYFSFIGGSHGVKRHFSYLYHDEKGKQNPEHVLQAVIPREPYGHELHLYRQDSDAYFLAVATQYGVTVLQNTQVDNVDIDDNGVVVSAQNEKYTSDYIVDAGGFRSLLADKFNLRTFQQKTHSRTIFTHMVNVSSYHSEGVSKSDFGIPYSLAEGTLHHLFKGGWMWVIPFNNHPESVNSLCSVGLLLDPRIHPEDSAKTAEQEFFSFIEKYPQINKHLEGAKAVRDWVRTGRIQYSSKKVVGDRFSLMGHAAGFIDPLFSKGLYSSFSCLGLLAHTLIEAKAEGDYSAARFKAVEDKTLALIGSNDRLINGAFQSFNHYPLWQQYSALWLVGAYLEGLKLTTVKMQLKKRDRFTPQEYFKATSRLELVGGGFTEFKELAAEIESIVYKYSSASPEEAGAGAQKIKSMLLKTPWVPFVFKDIAQGMNHLPQKKFKLRLFKKKGGLMSAGAYREYFFKGITWFDILKFLIKEKKMYSIKAIQKKHKAYLEKHKYL